MTDSPQSDEAAEIVFREIPLLIEVEQWIARERGIMWRPEFEKRVDEISVALFGIKRWPKPQQADFSNQAAFMAAEFEWDQWQANIRLPRTFAEQGYDEVDWLEAVGVDIWDEQGNELRCAEWFVDQAIAAAGEVGDAKFTPDGSGSTAPADAEQWGASLARAAREFSRKK